MKKRMQPLAERRLRKSALPLLFCSGCGNGTLLGATIRAFEELDIWNQVSLVGGIGCSGWIPVYIHVDVIHALHGRALAVATGLKLALPRHKVVVFTGDGDCMAIGGNHFLHAARRNIDLTVIMVNNQIYGMTGGQVAPTTPSLAKTKTTPFGNPEAPLDACALAISAGATFVARWTTAHPRQLQRAIADAIRHNGFSFVEVLSQCPTAAGRNMWGTGDPSELLEKIKASTVHTSQAPVDRAPCEPIYARVAHTVFDGKYLVGTFLMRDDRPEFTMALREQMNDAATPN